MKQSTNKIQINKKKSNPQNILPKKSSVIYKSIHIDIQKLIDRPQNDKRKDSKDLSRDQIIPQQLFPKEKLSIKADTEIMKSTLKKLNSQGILSDNFFKQNVSNKINEINRNFICKGTFIYHYIIGKGGFGKVWKVESKKNRQHYALKEMLKSLVMTKKSIQSVMNEKNLLSNIKHPFIVNMHYAFQDRQTLFLVMDLMPGGDLRYHLGNKKKFTEIQAKFFMACIILGLEYLHQNNIIHRDIKPQNLVLDNKGYLRITDLGIARNFKPQNSTDTSGTPGYMSPEVICRQNHSFVSDFFAVGVIAYEFMLGKRPYTGRTRKQIRDQILAKQVNIKKMEVPENWSHEAADFINKLIQRKPQNRLGFNGIQQIKQHPWVRELNWKKINNKEIESPFIPTMKKDNFDQDEQITIDDEEQAELIQKNSLLLRKNQFQSLFKGYYYDQNDQQKIQNYPQQFNKIQISKNCEKKSQKSNSQSYAPSHSNSSTKESVTSSHIKTVKYGNLTLERPQNERAIHREYR